METANEIMKQVVPILMIPINRYLRYLILCTKYMRDMGIKIIELNAAKVGVEEKTRHNISNNLEVPAQVKGWLDDVGKINAQVENVPNNIGSCFNLKIRHTAGRSAVEISEEIDSVMRRYKEINWADHPIPPGRVHSMKSSTSTLSTKHNDFQSRELTFTKALKALDPNHKSHMIALCGMGGVGKTTMMQRLKKVAKEKRMFSYIIEAVIGEKTDPISIQEAISYYLGVELNANTKSVRADMLRQGFKAKSDVGKDKFLIILDDVWQSVDLEDIGLSPFPNQGVNFKVLLTSRDRHICTVMGVEGHSIFNVGLLTEAESKRLFWQFVEGSDPELHKIGEDIVSKCCGLPIAIKTMACTLRDKSTDAWKDALSRLEHHDIENVASKVFKASYDNLQDEETKSTFFLCGLFPEDSNIPMEELVRYGWGLKLFKKVYTIREARTRLNTCIERLIYTNLLIKVDDVQCIKMHDLIRSFVLDMFSKVEHASIVNHGNTLEWPADDMHDSCKGLSLTCKGICEFCGDLKFPNLMILKLMHGDKSLRFPQNFYEGMQKLQVISYDKMKYPLLPLSSECSTNLRVLHLHECSLQMFDFSSIGNLLNLEVLSFADSCIQMLPSTIGNLKKLRVLDLRGSDDLHIEQGILKNLVKLEELYMGFYDEFRHRGKGIYNMTDDNYNEIAERSKGLSALEIEFFRNNAQPKNMSFEKLEKFKISVGRRYLYGDYMKHMYAVQNTLKLVTKKGELLDSRLNELFVKTEMLCLSVDDMNDLGDLDVKSSRFPQPSSFKILRVLVVSMCAELRYLFTIGVAKDLSNLEHLEVDSCDNMEELICSENAGKKTITFLKLKVLCLFGLPKLSGLCHNVNRIELLQLVELKLSRIGNITSIYPKNKLETSCFLKAEVLVPKLEKLSIIHMDNLKEIWPCDFRTSDEVNLREIYVNSCDKLMNLFPCNPMPLLHHLQELQVKWCGSIEVLFNIDLDCAGEIGEGGIKTNLRSIEVDCLGKLREVWRIKGDQVNSGVNIRSFQAVEKIMVKRCKRFRNLFTPTGANFDLGALMEISIEDCGGERGIFNESEKSSQEEKQEIGISFLSCLTHSSQNLHKLKLMKCQGVDVVFEIESPTSRELVTTHHNQEIVLPYLEDLYIRYMNNMSHVWKCNWNKFVTLPKEQSESPFYNLTTIYMYGCRRIKYLFSPLMAKLLSNLKKVHIEFCDGIEEVVSNRDDKDEEMTTFTNTSTILFPHLDSLHLSSLKTLKHIGGGGGAKFWNNELSFDNTIITTTLDQSKSSEAGGVFWSLCQYSREIEISRCNALSSVIPCYAAGQSQKLQVLKIKFCNGMKEVFETQETSSNKSGCDEGKGGTPTPAIPRINDAIVPKLPYLKILEIVSCEGLEHIFTFSALESLRHLKKLKIWNCKAMKVIVKREEYASASSSKKVVVFPRLKSIVLKALPELVGFFLGMNEFRWPLLDEVVIEKCPKMIVFASGGSTAPKLKSIKTTFGIYSVDQHGLNFQTTFPPTSERTPWSFHKLIELDVKHSHDVKKIIPSSELLQLQKLGKIRVSGCKMVEEVFEALEESGRNRNSSSGRGFDESSQTTTTLINPPNLTQLELVGLDRLRNLWKRNQWTVFEFPNLTRVEISECDRLEHVFTSSMVGSLLQLQELCIKDCGHMEEVIVVKAEEESDDKTNETLVLPRLNSLTLKSLPRLKAFSLGKEDFSLPLLDSLAISYCPAMTTFTKGNSTTPQLKEIEINYNSFYAGEDINSFIKMNKRNSEKRKTD
ncbi:uncharacterized protein LOC111908479 isoform X2 [Lactuca sativa]|nr:uncharacterized protein LOC111908479 isoform X2 [Lactuca sativa]